ncbi:MAG: hypothetical protein EOO24_58785, partial [Comamonadaceae bacterium]
MHASGRVGVLAIHGVGDPEPGGTARALARLLVARAGYRHEADGSWLVPVVPVPTGGTLPADDASLAFRDEAHAASVLLNARCLSADDRTPLVALTNHLLIGATEREYLSQEA